jgi:hypothetical protein
MAIAGSSMRLEDGPERRALAMTAVVPRRQSITRLDTLASP